MKKILYLSAVVVSVMSSVEGADLLRNSVQPTPVKRPRMGALVVINDEEATAQIAELQERLKSAKRERDEAKQARDASYDLSQFELASKDRELDELRKDYEEQLNSAEDARKKAEAQVTSFNDLLQRQTQELAKKQKEFEDKLEWKNLELGEKQRKLTAAQAELEQLRSTPPAGDDAELQEELKKLQDQNAALQEQVRGTGVCMKVRQSAAEKINELVTVYYTPHKKGEASPTLERLKEEVSSFTAAEIVAYKELINGIMKLFTHTKAGNRRQSVTTDVLRQEMEIKGKLEEAHEEFAKAVKDGADVHEEGMSSEALEAEFSAIDAEFKGPATLDSTSTDTVLPRNIGSFDDMKQVIRYYRETESKRLDEIAGIICTLRKYPITDVNKGAIIKANSSSLQQCFTALSGILFPDTSGKGK